MTTNENVNLNLLVYLGRQAYRSRRQEGWMDGTHVEVVGMAQDEWRNRNTRKKPYILRVGRFDHPRKK